MDEDWDTHDIKVGTLEVPSCSDIVHQLIDYPLRTELSYVFVEHIPLRRWNTGEQCLVSNVQNVEELS